MHRLTRDVLPQMLERKRGTMVVVASATSLRGRKGGVAVYGAARGAQHGYMKNVAMEVAPYVNINATAQTYVDNITYWPMEYRETAEFRERMAENPAARLATGCECAQTVLLLAGPESDFFYGQIIPFCRRLDGVSVGGAHAVPAYSERRLWGRTRQLPSAGANGRIRR